jgi:putative hydrolase of the HAD superfamily
LTHLPAAVSFDLWDTLYADDPVMADLRTRLRHELVARHLADRGLAVPPARLAAALAAAGRQAHSCWHRDHRTLGAAERLLHACGCLGIELEPDGLAALATAVEEIGALHPPRMLDGAAVTVRSLAGRCKLGLLSDTGQTPARILRRLLDRDGLLDCFAVTCFSDELGSSKPGRAGFQTLLASLELPADQVLHVGDNPETDVAGALGMGLRAFHLAPTPHRRFVGHPAYAQGERIIDLLAYLKVPAVSCRTTPAEAACP